MAFVLVMELVGGKWQTVVGIGFEAPWVVGWFILAGVAYALPDWQHIQLATSAPAIVCGVVMLFVPESPKWLLCNGKVDKAEGIVRKAAE